MKKASRSLALVLAFCLVAAMLASCGKKPSDSAAFKEIAQKKGYHTLDTLPQFVGNPQVKEAFMTAPEEESFRIEFYVLDGVDFARSFYNNLSNTLDEQKGESDSSSSANGKNYAKRAVTSNGLYSMVEYVENTLVYVPRTDAANKPAIEAFLSEMNY